MIQLVYVFKTRKITSIFRFPLDWKFLHYYDEEKKEGCCVMKYVKKFTDKMKSRNWTVVMLNAAAFMFVLLNVNSACAWIDGQPEVPKEADRFRRH